MRIRRWSALVAVVVGTGLGGGLAVAAPASADVSWLCKPGVSPDPCVGDLTTTYGSEGDAVRTPAVDPAPAVDCFYVYPTVSEQRDGPNAQKLREPSVVAIAKFQAQRYSQHCRVFAPLYRQRTLAGITSPLPADEARAASDLAYGDVREAFRQYLAQDSAGRGFVLIGHSQGTGVLRRLIREEVDPDPALRARLVSALLLGGNVTVRRGSDVGGDFQHVRACRSTTQLGCVVAFSTFNEPVPNPSLFGRPDGRLLDDTAPAGPDLEVLCTNPADLAGNARTELRTLAPTEPFPGTLGAGLSITYGGPAPTADTPWIEPAERYTGACEESDGAHVLELQPVGDARELNPSPTPEWGLHLVDANIALGQLVDLVASESATYVAATTPAVPPTPAPAVAPAGPVTPTVRATVRGRTGRRVVVRVDVLGTAGRACAGNARVSIYAPGGKRVLRGFSSVQATCVGDGVSAALPRRLVGRRVTVRVAYLGASAVRPASASSATVRVRR